MHLSGEGEGISGSRAQSGYGLLLALLLRPVLLVFGLYAAIALLYVLGWFVDQTLGTTLQNPPNSVFEAIGLIAMYVIAVIALATLCLRTITLVPELAFRWIDVAVGDLAGSAQDAAEAGLNAGGRGVPGLGDRAVGAARPVGQMIGKWWRDWKNENQREILMKNATVWKTRAAGLALLAVAGGAARAQGPMRTRATTPIPPLTGSSTVSGNAVFSKPRARSRKVITACGLLKRQKNGSISFGVRYIREFSMIMLGMASDWFSNDWHAQNPNAARRRNTGHRRPPISLEGLALHAPARRALARGALARGRPAISGLRPLSVAVGLDRGRSLDHEISRPETVRGMAERPSALIAGHPTGGNAMRPAWIALAVWIFCIVGYIGIHLYLGAAARFIGPTPPAWKSSRATAAPSAASFSRRF